MKQNQVNVMDKNINKEFGYLTIKERVDDYITPKGLHMKRYLCRCNKCGKIKEITYNNLLHGQKSCGCSRKHPHKYNQYDLSGKYGIVTHLILINNFILT